MIKHAHRENLSKWDERFLALAESIAQWSKGPRKRVGAVAVRQDRSVASMGYNGPPRGFDDRLFLAMDRDEQHKHVIHAEVNALRQMLSSDLESGLTLYVSPLYPCYNCALETVQSGKFARIVAHCGHISDDWRESAKQAEAVFAEAGLKCLFVR